MNRHYSIKILCTIEEVAYETTMISEKKANSHYMYIYKKEEVNLCKRKRKKSNIAALCA